MDVAEHQALVPAQALGVSPAPLGDPPSAGLPCLWGRHPLFLLTAQATLLGRELEVALEDTAVGPSPGGAEGGRRGCVSRQPGRDADLSPGYSGTRTCLCIPSRDTALVTGATVCGQGRVPGRWRQTRLC